MRWFKHDSDANSDAKLRRLRIKYGMEGYGLYWYCLELIARGVEKNRLTFELEHDAELIADDTGIHYERVQEMMTYMVTLGLFENSNGIITCLKMASRIDETTSKHPEVKQLQALIRSQSGDNREIIPTVSGNAPARIEENRTEQNRTEKNLRDPSGATPPHLRNAEQVLSLLNSKVGKNYQSKNPAGKVTANAKIIVDRLKDGYTVDQCRAVVAIQYRKWWPDDKMRECLTPQTLFRKSNFEKYVAECQEDA